MFNRKDAISLAVLSLLASTGLVMAESTDVKTPGLSLNPSVVQADVAPAAADRAPLMMALDKVGAARPLDSLNLNIYGWVEAGYTYDNRRNATFIAPGPFNHEVGNHFMLNQIDLRVERLVDSKKWDVGGMVELMYGTDGAGIHSNGLEYGNSTAEDRFHPQYQFDIVQAYIDVNVPVGNGLKVRAGRFVTFASYETINPTTNPFYSHSYLFSLVPFTHTGIVGFYQLNEQWGMAAGISRGWDQATEDNNGAIDALGQISFTPNKQVAAYLNWIVGPENNSDSSHYRTLIDPVVTWQVTDALKLGAEGLYLYDGGVNTEDQPVGTTHAYGDAYGAALYAGYTINDYLTVNGRGEWAHGYLEGIGGLGDTSEIPGIVGGSTPTLNVWEVTLGVTVTPLPKDPIGKNLLIRPEVRYDFSEDHVYSAGGTQFKDQLTFAADVIFKF